MIAVIAALVAGQPVAAKPPSTASDDIVVIGLRKLDDWRAILIFERDVPKCRVIKTTNDPDLDRIGCTAMVQCFAETKDQFVALNDKTLTKSKRRTLWTAANRDRDDCLKVTRRTMMVELTNRHPEIMSER